MIISRALPFHQQNIISMVETLEKGFKTGGDSLAEKLKFNQSCLELQLIIIVLIKVTLRKYK